MPEMEDEPMAWHVFVQDKAFVTAALRRGECDVVQVVAKVAETDFFRRLLGQGTLARLAASYPTPRASSSSTAPASSSPAATTATSALLSCAAAPPCSPA